MREAESTATAAKETRSAEQLGPEERGADAREQWRKARLFQMRAQKVLAKVRVPFVEWLLLAALADLEDETGDAASQRAIAERAGLTRAVASYWMILLAEEGLVDRGPDMAGPAYRIILSTLGRNTLRACSEQLALHGLLP